MQITPQTIPGSIPVVRAGSIGPIAQWLEQGTHNKKRRFFTESSAIIWNAQVPHKQADCGYSPSSGIVQNHPEIFHQVTFLGYVSSNALCPVEIEWLLFTPENFTTH